MTLKVRWKGPRRRVGVELDPVSATYTKVQWNLFGTFAYTSRAGVCLHGRLDRRPSATGRDAMQR
jgi:hypothetical protein